uniref:Cytochrome c oxidase subunit 3 n=1 Tax=Polytomella sp. Pringsheim 198.80 TaxID=37502 RepID=Q9FV98_9CHLO|nr:cytochrome c oxidase subunit III [Polytomella sp. Pringsheim 198.80]AAK82665.1 cytochrome c oxidase subunit III [Polytomella sp. Pringsheim 198.80]|mmetsp:Transcript_22673/g.40163  ORF Transcript_22673/g.40163 Transcript_22673/m.40163 type:complete len:371 (+) Transcript_22673:68-1180(+)|eukprot:CAMPEP_0175041144 /NCGR_PEP_ID=MMETSP0052_2-20121109/1741_1 /TAXON_ID=51329 ORGANISM="Polytomella parva, Strain SAG 63-3" /NCGR_SAMPLE_ID=MMETSP0052_2 /ASSEMBLY_ACC=CAM_ASM_000194 /LENGTH=370 /DNA_ID=CAMNT_0016303605 /DNA_START=57 /DNA_END=1169 /DNA_ORIENTATION=+
MRSQLLKALTRAPAGFSAQQSFNALRSGASYFSTDSVSRFQRKEESLFKGFSAVPKTTLPFAAHLSTFTQEREEKGVKAVEAPKVNSALAALPPRRSMSSDAGHHLSPREHYLVHTANRHPFHVLPDSPWPLFGSWAACNVFLGLAQYFHGVAGSAPLLFGSVAHLTLLAITWWRDCAIEAEMGMHTDVSRQNMVSGMWVFIVSEAVLFIGLLWACMDLGISPSVHVQMQWPPVGVHAIGWDNRALVMSAVLAASYYSANIAMVAKDPKTVLAALSTTVGFGAMFLYDQFLEYTQTPFTLTDSPYGTTFFMTTGFHGMHVLVGTIYLAAVTAMYSRTKKAGVALTTSVLYWHFVDIVWIAVYGIIYVGQY